MNTTHAFILYTSKVLKDGSHPIMLRLYINKKRSYFGIGLSAMEDEWNKKDQLFKGSRSKENNKRLSAKKHEVEIILNHFNFNNIPITKEAFQRKFTNSHVNGDVYQLFDLKMEQLKAMNKLGNMAAYSQCKAALMSFTKKKKIHFSDVTPTFLNEFETFMFRRGCNAGGLAAYLRSFRALFNYAIQQGETTRESYPFKNQFNAEGYDMAKLKVGFNPRAMSEEDLEKFKNFDYSKHPQLEDNYKIALFIYYARGINFADLAHLKWTDIYSQRINYIRRKTHKSYSIKISEPLEEILNHFKDIHDIYVFPIFNDFHKTPSQKENRLKKTRALFNKDLKKIAAELKISVNLTSYVLRHSFATTLKRKGASVEKISQAMGHKNTDITMAYLKKFSNEEVDALDDLL